MLGVFHLALSKTRVDSLRTRRMPSKEERDPPQPHLAEGPSVREVLLFTFGMALAEHSKARLCGPKFSAATEYSVGCPLPYSQFILNGSPEILAFHLRALAHATLITVCFSPAFLP